MSRHPTPLPDPLSVPIQHKRDRDEQYRQSPQQAACPTKSQPLVHRVRKQWEPGPKRTPHEIIACIHGRDVFGIRVAEVCQDAHEQ